ncbi:hypothetical protein M9Y10_034448 [Tritrichomonas musculus]|uniref:DUF3447 domain-containing protein n=1 Tax=Tritrichomonas musculus TaxID=1915356 RepID=A0ABR2KEY4_9EUKA
MSNFINIIEESLNLLVEIQNQFIEIIGELQQNEREQKYNLFVNSFENSEILEQSSKLYLFLQYLGNIINFHYEKNSFLDLISKFIQHFSENIKNLLNQNQLVKIAVKSRLLLIILLEQQILDKKFLIQRIVHINSHSKERNTLFEYLSPEFDEYEDSYKSQFEDELVYSHYLLRKEVLEGDNSDTYKGNEEEEIDSYKILNIDLNEYIKCRKEGENQETLCQNIRDDDIDSFVSLFEKTQTNINKRTNSFLYDSNQYPSEKNEPPSFFEYAAYKGSLEIFRHLLLRNAKFSKQMWFYAIHGGNNDIIHDVEEKLKVECNYKAAFEYAIQCHQNYIADYIYQTYLNPSVLIDGIFKSISSYNFSYFQNLLETLKITKEIDIEKKNFNFLKKLVKFSYYDSVYEILDSNFFKVFIDPEKFLLIPIKGNDSLMTETLLKYLSFSNQDIYTNLIENAIMSDSPESLKILLNQESIQNIVQNVIIFNIFYSFYIFVFFIRIKILQRCDKNEK